MIGGAVWAGVAYGTGYEIDYIAWGVGAVVGLGVAVGSKGTAGVLAGIIAAALAAGSILTAKYVVVELIVNKEFADASITVDEVAPTTDEEFWIAYIADRVVEERERAGQTVTWPRGVDPSEAASEAEYPKDIWADAKARWDAMSPSERESYRDAAAASIVQNINAALGTIKSQITHEGFFKSFGPIDIIFGLLAIGTAFKLGSAEKATSSAGA